jgi:hypothetical protein
MDNFRKKTVAEVMAGLSIDEPDHLEEKAVGLKQMSDGAEWLAEMREIRNRLINSDDFLEKTKKAISQFVAWNEQTTMGEIEQAAITAVKVKKHYLAKILFDFLVIARGSTK